MIDLDPQPINMETEEKFNQVPKENYIGPGTPIEYSKPKHIELANDMVIAILGLKDAEQQNEIISHIKKEVIESRLKKVEQYASLLEENKKIYESLK